MERKGIETWSPLSIRIDSDARRPDHGSTGAGAALPAPGRIRVINCVEYVGGSVRSQPWFTTLAALLAIAAGLVAISIAPRGWIARSQTITGEAPPADAATSATRINPDDLVALLRQPAFVREALDPADREGSVSSASFDSNSLPVDAVVNPAASFHPALDAVRRFVRAGLRLPEQSEPEVVSAYSTDRAIHLAVRAADPAAAIDASRRLIRAAAEQLRSQRQQALKRRSDELAITAAMARERLTAMEIECARLQKEAGRQDPQAFATQLETELLEARIELASLDVTRSEFLAKRTAALAQIQEMDEQRIGETVTGENPRKRELADMISDLEAEYASKRTKLKDLHPDMIALRDRIDSFRLEFDALEDTIVIRQTMAPDPRRAELEAGLKELDREIASLDARQSALTIAAEALRNELAIAAATAEEFASRRRERDAARTRLESVRNDQWQVEASIASGEVNNPVSFLTEPAVANPLRPDSPRLDVYLALTSLAVVFSVVMLPTARSIVTGRVVASWQIEHLSGRAPLPIGAVVPAASIRRLTRSTNSRKPD